MIRMSDGWRKKQRVVASMSAEINGFFFPPRFSVFLDAPKGDVDAVDATDEASVRSLHTHIRPLPTIITPVSLF